MGYASIIYGIISATWLVHFYNLFSQWTLYTVIQESLNKFALHSLQSNKLFNNDLLAYF